MPLSIKCFGLFGFGCKDDKRTDGITDEFLSFFSFFFPRSETPRTLTLPRNEFNPGLAKTFIIRGLTSRERVIAEIGSYFDVKSYVIMTFRRSLGEGKEGKEWGVKSLAMVMAMVMVMVKALTPVWMNSRYRNGGTWI